MRTALGYPDEGQELRIVEEQVGGHPLGDLGPAVSLAEVEDLQRAVQEVYVDPLIRQWIVRLVRATRELDEVATGSSVRGSLALDRAVRAWALLDGRDYVSPDDVERLFIPVLLHRIFFTPSFLAEARDLGWRVAGERFRARCLTLAPPPGPDLAREAPAAATV